MSISTELTRLQTARNKLRTKLIALGLVTATAKLDDCAAAVDGITNQGAVSATVQEGDTFTIPAGYHNGSGTVSGVAGGGNYKLQSKTVAPTKAQQAVTPDSGYYGLSDDPGCVSGCILRHSDCGGYVDRQGVRHLGWYSHDRYDGEQRRGHESTGHSNNVLHDSERLSQRCG